MGSNQQSRRRGGPARPDGVAMTQPSTQRTWVAQSESEAIELEATGWRRDDPDAKAPRAIPKGAVETGPGDDPASPAGSAETGGGSP